MCAAFLTDYSLVCGRMWHAFPLPTGTGQRSRTAQKRSTQTYFTLSGFLGGAAQR